VDLTAYGDTLPSGQETKKKFLKFPVAYETNSQIMSLTRLGEEETVPWFIRME
jgi:hypothetical protein